MTQKIDEHLEEGQECPSCKEGKLQVTGRCTCSTCGYPPCSFCENGHLECDECGQEYVGDHQYNDRDYYDY